MRLPSLGNGADTLQDTFGIYHATRLEADPAMKDLAAAWDKAQTRLGDRIAMHKAAEKAEMRAMAIRDAEDAFLDDTVRTFANAILGKVGNNHKAALYRKYFPEGLDDVVSAPLEVELQKLGVLLSRLAEEGDEALKGHAPLLKAAGVRLTGAMAAHKACLDAEIQAFGLEKTEKVLWLDAYKKSYRDLGRIFYMDIKKADTYFKPAPKGKKPPDDPPAGGVGTKG